MPGPSRSWNQAPYEPLVSDTTNQFFQWITNILNQIQPKLFPPGTPAVTTISHPNAVQIIWNEVAGGTSYAIFETSSNSVPPGVPFATVPANLGGISNSVLRGSLNDTVTRFYWVQAIGTNGVRGPISVAVPGTALSGAAAVIPVSTNPVNQGGVGGGVGGGGAIPGKGFNRILLNNA
jgi:hypothetical protein